MTSIKAKNVNHPNYSENLNEKKYTLVRNAILESLPSNGDSLSFDELRDRVESYLQEVQDSKALFPKSGSITWYTKAVQLDLEARGDIARVPDVSPIRLRKNVNE